MKKEYNLTIKYNDGYDECEIDEHIDEEEIIFTVDDKDIKCPKAMVEMLSRLDSTILGLS